MSLAGSCLCGAVRFTIRAPLGPMSHCHCGMCRKAHGAAFATYAGAPRDAFDVEDSEQALRWFDSSDPVQRAFCGRCGASLFFRHAAAPTVEFVAVGTLDGDPGRRPEAHIFVTSKAPWVEIDDDLTRHDGDLPEPDAW